MVAAVSALAAVATFRWPSGASAPGQAQSRPLQHCGAALSRVLDENYRLDLLALRVHHLQLSAISHRIAHQL
jgi:hypothetical protein